MQSATGDRRRALRLMWCSSRVRRSLNDRRFRKPIDPRPSIGSAVPSQPRLPEAAGGATIPGKASRVEPTCWSLLALASTADGPRDAWLAAIDPHLQFLGRSQRPDGLLQDLAIAAESDVQRSRRTCVSANRRGNRRGDSARLVPALLRVKGVSVENKDRASDALQGWPWIEGTFSWVEPTCVLPARAEAERRRHPSAAADARIREAEQVLLTRSCATGGWNYGNASVLDQDLRPYVSTTALGLLALQDRRADPVVVRGLEFLQRSQTKEPSGMALALTALCLRVHGLPCEQVEHALLDDVARVNRLNNLNIVAMVLYALSGEQHGAAAFTV